MRLRKVSVASGLSAARTYSVYGCTQLLELNGGKCMFEYKSNDITNTTDKSSQITKDNGMSKRTFKIVRQLSGHPDSKTFRVAIKPVR